MKKILYILIGILLTISTTNANGIEFYWEKDDSWWFDNSNISIIKKKIYSLQDKFWLNTDVIILWKNDKKWCYLEANFDNCVKENYWYSSDIIITLKMKSDISDKWDIRSYMDNKNHPIITTDTLKNIQDAIVYNFWNNNFSKWISEYYTKLDFEISFLCSELLIQNEKLWWNSYENMNSCKVIEIKKLFDKNDILSKELAEKNSFKRNVNIVVFIIIFLSWMIWLNMYYLWRLRKIFKDIKFQLINLEEWKTFKEDLNITKKSLETLIKKLEIYLGNTDKIWIKSRRTYLEMKKESNKIENIYEKSVKNYKSQDKLKEELDNFKNINL